MLSWVLEMRILVRALARRVNARVQAIVVLCGVETVEWAAVLEESKV